MFQPVSPNLARGLVLAAELVVFLLVTVAMANFISYASADRFGESDAPPADFPVLVFEGDRANPGPKDYSVVPWSEWQSTRERRPDASLLLPEQSGSLQLPDHARAKFNVTEGDESQQTVELTWVVGERERHAVYLAQAREIKPRYVRSSGTATFLFAAIVGFLAGVWFGKVLRRRYLAPAARTAN